MRRVVVMDLSRHNVLVVGDRRWFVLETAGRAELVLDSCPHRGGPLSLARLTPDGRRLACPWHGTRVGTAAVRRTALPMVRTGDEAVVVLPGVGPEVPVTARRRRVLANLPPMDPLCDKENGLTGPVNGNLTDTTAGTR
ncbi:MAG TPA: Rieske 2Fe-2S domain-containing protein [Pseudonocardiaceae bacterium]